MRNTWAVIFLLGGCAWSSGLDAWSIDDRYSEHVVDGYIGYMTDKNPETIGHLNAILQKNGDGSVSVTVGAWGCTEQEGTFFDGLEWNSRPASVRAALVKRALVDGIAHIAKTCRADPASLKAQVQQFDQAFGDLDIHPK